MTHNSIVAAIIAARKEMAPLTANKTAQMGKYSFEYVSLGKILDIVMPALNSHGVLLTQNVRNDGEGVFVETKLLFEDGTHISSGPLFWNGEMGTIHDMGKIVTTMKRIQLKSLLGLAETEEEDEHETAPANQRQRPGTQPSSVAAGERCPDCNAPAGRAHATNCPRVQGANAQPSIQPATSTADVGQSDVDFGMDKEERAPSEIEFVASLRTNPFYEEELKAAGILTAGHAYRLAEKEAGVTYMPVVPAEGKKMSQYGYLCSLINKLTNDKDGHTIVLSYLMGRYVHKMAPPPYPVKGLIDNLVNDDEGIKKHTEDVLSVIYETCKMLWEEQQSK